MITVFLFVEQIVESMWKSANICPLPVKGKQETPSSKSEQEGTHVQRSDYCWIKRNGTVHVWTGWRFI